MKCVLLKIYFLFKKMKTISLHNFENFLNKVTFGIYEICIIQLKSMLVDKQGIDI